MRPACLPILIKSNIMRAPVWLLLREGAGRVEELGADEATAHDERGARIVPW